MPLNIASAGDFTPYLKYDAKTGRFKVKAEGSDVWVEISNFNLAFDMEHIRTGWIWFPQDGPPHKVWSPSVTADVGPRPGPDYKLGFEVVVFGNLKIPGTDTPMGLRTWSANAFATVSCINEMYAEYERQLPNNPGKIPIYTFQRVTEVESAYGTNYRPHFVLGGWVVKDKIPALETYQTSKVQVLPPPARAPQPKPQNGGNFTVADRPGYQLMQRERQPIPRMQQIPSDPIDDIADTF